MLVGEEGEVIIMTIGVKKHHKGIYYESVV
jgi:hypothetical protein